MHEGRDISLVMRERPGGKLHAAEQRRDPVVMDGLRVGSIVWVRRSCDKVWRTQDSVDEFDYRYRGGPLCQHPACAHAFREVLVG